MAEEGAQPSLEEVRWRIDAIDAQLHALIDERATLATVVAAAKRAAGDGDKFGLRPAREAQVIRTLLERERFSVTPALLIKIWRELMADSLARQGPFHVSVYGGHAQARTLELARIRFGVAPHMYPVGKAEDALASARTQGGVAVLTVAAETPWWGRMLVTPQLKVFAALPCLSVWGPTAALAVAEVAVEPTGADDTFWVTDSPKPAAAIEEALGRDGVAASLLADVGGLKLFALAGFYMDGDERLARAPGSLTGVIGAAPSPFDV